MLKGLFTALVTPFKKDGTIDEDAYRALIEKQIEAGVAGVSPCGTTGESPTLSYEEHNNLIRIAVEQVKGRCEVLAGTGSNSTQEAIMLTEHAKAMGATASLQIVPYYNKPTQEGMYQHFKTIAEAVDIPIVVYNIQGRTGVNMQTDTLMRLAKIKNIIGVKEASGNVSQMIDVINAAPEGFSILSGDDKLTLPLIACGGHGLVSVASNVLPKKMNDFVNAGLNGDFTKMQKMNKELADLFGKMFIETNPIPVKKLMALKGWIESAYRLPLCEPKDSTTEVMKELIKKYGI